MTIIKHLRGRPVYRYKGYSIYKLAADSDSWQVCHSVRPDITGAKTLVQVQKLINKEG